VPQVYDIVTGFFPEKKPKGGTPDRRPLLVTQVLRSRKTGAIAVRVAYGTSQLRFPDRLGRDLIVQNMSDMDECGLQRPTRFVVTPDQQQLLIWDESNFAPWGAAPSPRRGRLTLDLQKEYAWLMSGHL
jgi:hypothetical protein